MLKPAIKPDNPRFSSGPCCKRPGYDVSKLDLSTLGRSHRAAPGRQALQTACEKTAALLQLPQEYRVAIVPASDTGAMEMALWSLLGARGVDVFAWESFGKEWVRDITEQLHLSDVRQYIAPYGQLPDLSLADAKRDIVFTWNGTTSGVKVPDGDWIADERDGLTICDATSAVFAMPMPWHKLDVVTFSWQKVLGGEGAHGMLILSPRAVQRLETYQPPWPLPKIFRLTKAGRLQEAIFNGATINTPSMLCVADYLDSLSWLERLGGQQGAIEKSMENFDVVRAFVQDHSWVDFLAQEVRYCSNTSVCLRLQLADEQVQRFIRLLASEGVAYDIGAYRDAPVGLRLWCGATIDKHDLQALMPWLAWAYHEIVSLENV